MEVAGLEQAAMDYRQRSAVDGRVHVRGLLFLSRQSTRGCSYCRRGNAKAELARAVVGSGPNG
eukprot:11537503-Alexandrium_andersonii.AAC.1